MNTCGNGVVEPSEMCDPGTAAGCPTSDASCDDGDVCTQDSFHIGAQNTCQSYCTNPPRIPSLASSDGCCPPGATRLTDADCVARCGDGIKDANEECDDGNGIDTDACPRTCKNAFCTDGFVRAGVEECDDGNTDNLDACDNGCNAYVLCDGTTARAGCYRNPALLLGLIPYDYEIGDFDGDKHLDIAVLDNNNSSVDIHYGAGNGTFAKTSVVIGPDRRYMAAGDFTGDGIDDLVVNGPGRCAQSGVRGFDLYRGKADRTLGVAEHFDRSSSIVVGLTTFQFDADPAPELLMWTNCPGDEMALRILDANFSELYFFNNFSAPDRMYVVNADGDPQDEGVEVSLGVNGSASNPLSPAYGWANPGGSISPGFHSVDAADLNGDGVKDLIGDMTNPTTGVGVGWMSGFGVLTSIPLDPGVTGPVVGHDYDADSDIDLAVVHAEQPIVLVYFRQPNGSYANPVRTRTGLTSHDMSFSVGSAGIPIPTLQQPSKHADFNEDGTPDLVIYGDSSLFLLLSR